MASLYQYDPAVNKLEEVITEAEKLGVADSVLKGLKEVDCMIKERDRYCERMTSRPSVSIQDLIKDTIEHPWQKVFVQGKTKWNINPGMLSGNLEGYALKFLVNAAKATKVLDVGLFTGCSALNLAEVIPEGGKVTSCESDPYLADLASSFLDKSRHGQKVQILLGNAIDSLKGLAEKGEKFDFIFIDADKAGKCEYFDISLKELLAVGGTIALDNALSGGRSYLKDAAEKDIMMEVNDIIASRKDIYHVLLPVRDGIMLVRRKEDMDCSSIH